jgi:hypothetical protein
MPYFRIVTAESWVQSQDIPCAMSQYVWIKLGKEILRNRSHKITPYAVVCRKHAYYSFCIRISLLIKLRHGI